MRSRAILDGTIAVPIQSVETLSTLDLADEPAFESGETVHLGSGNNLYFGTNGDDTVFGEGGNDTLRGERGDDLLKGGARDDQLIGSGGDDRLFGGSGDDFLADNRGRNEYWGGKGQDQMALGSGKRDTLVYTFVDESQNDKSDEVTGFEAGRDKIDLTRIDADVNTAGDDAFTFIGAAVFSGTAGELRYLNGVLAGDVDGDGLADFEVRIGQVTDGDILN